MSENWREEYEKATAERNALIFEVERLKKHLREEMDANSRGWKEVERLKEELDSNRCASCEIRLLEIGQLKRELAAKDAEIAKLKTAVFDTLNTSPREQTEMHDPLEHIKTHFVPVWKYNELVDEIAALTKALDELYNGAYQEHEHWLEPCGLKPYELSPETRALCERLEREVWSKKS